MNPIAALGYIYGFLGPPIEWALNQLTKAFSDVGVLSGIGAFGLAIVLVTMIIRGLLFPLFGWQLKTQRRIQAEQRLIAPQMQAIRKKYKKEPQKLQEEMMKLYREHGISPFSSLTGCLPLLVQLPIIYGLYSGIRNASELLTKSGHHNLGFLWVGGDVCDPVDKTSHIQYCGLSSSPLHIVGGIGTHPLVLIIPILAALATVVQSRMMMQPPRPDMSDQEKQMYNISKNMVFIAPVMVLLFGLNLPQGIALYWLTQSIFMIVQQWYVVGWGGMKVPSWFPGHGRVTPLSFSQPPAMALARSGASRPAQGGAGAPGQTRVERRPQGGRAAGGARSRRVTSHASGGSRRRRGR